ncbi:MAG: hypothetical protein K2P57_06220 [Burkholderiales bacterium]|nr:hypothetical protein [Burkholderiales bacterium]
MKKILFTLLMSLSQLAFADGSITILSPKDGSTLSSGMGNKLEYNVKLGPTGNHLHVYVDDQDPIVDRNVSGCPCKIDLPDLTPGRHTIVVKEATASHALTGLQTRVSVTVK